MPPLLAEYFASIVVDATTSLEIQLCSISTLAEALALHWTVCILSCQRGVRQHLLVLPRLPVCHDNGVIRSPTSAILGGVMALVSW
jgi:hypothetical protein